MRWPLFSLKVSVCRGTTVLSGCNAVRGSAKYGTKMNWMCLHLGESSLLCLDPLLNSRMFKQGHDHNLNHIVFILLAWSLVVGKN